MSETTKWGEERFEFLLYINNNIICQRYIHVKNFNEDFVNPSHDNTMVLKELVDSVLGTNNGTFGECGIIPQHLKDKTITYLWDNYNPYSTYQDDMNKTDKDDNFQFEVKVDGKQLVIGELNGNLFPPRVRYAVNIKEIIPEITSEIKYFLSLKNLSKVSA
jgi:hypothetical protein